MFLWAEVSGVLYTYLGVKRKNSNISRRAVVLAFHPKPFEQSSTWAISWRSVMCQGCCRTPGFNGTSCGQGFNRWLFRGKEKEDLVLIRKNLTCVLQLGWLACISVCVGISYISGHCIPTSIGRADGTWPGPGCSAWQSFWFVCLLYLWPWLSGWLPKAHGIEGRWPRECRIKTQFLNIEEGWAVGKEKIHKMKQEIGHVWL